MNERAAEWEREEEAREAREALRRSRIPAEFADAVPGDLPPTLREWAESPTGCGLIIVGGFGVGKTHAACAMLRANLGDARYVTAQEITERSYPSAEGGWEFLGRCRGVRLLAIDDLGKDKATQWMVSELFKIVNARHQSKRPTVITTNLTFSALEAYLSQGDPITAGALVSRLKDYRRVNATGKDRRGDVRA